MLMANRLSDWFGVSITEYPSEGQNLDVFSVNSKGIKLMIEIIWTETLSNFFRDILLLTRSDAHIKIVVSQSTVVQSSKFAREFRKTQISELKRGTVVPEMLDGDKILEDTDYRENYVKDIITKSLNQFNNQNTISNTINISVLPTKTSNHLEDTSLKNLKLYLDRINSASGERSQLTAWSDLEKQAITKRIWKIPEVWETLTDEILKDHHCLLLDGALSVLNRILLTARGDPGSGEVLSKARQLYKSKLEEILASTDASSEHYKSTSKQILEYLTIQDERFQLFWNSWKKFAREIKEDHRFEQYTRPFINDLIYASQVNKESILPELYTLIDSPEEYISIRAKGVHDIMFS